jgi:hypothetical protein
MRTPVLSAGALFAAALLFAAVPAAGQTTATAPHPTKAPAKKKAAPAPRKAAAPAAPAVADKAPGAAGETASWEKAPPTLLENQFLQSELALAGKPQFYMVFDLEAKKVLLKARGRVFREWTVRGLSFWGTGVPPAALTLVRKSALFTPQRVTLNPLPAEQAAALADSAAGTPAPGTFDIEALELSDMPTAYALLLSHGVRLTVSPVSQGFVAGLARLGHTLWWNASLPVRALWWKVRGEPFVAVEMVLEKDDARALYWAFPEGSQALIHQ